MIFNGIDVGIGKVEAINNNIIEIYSKDLEKKLVEVTKSYTATDFNFPVNGENIIITYNELHDNNMIDKLEVDNKKCDGYVELSFNNVTEYKAYIKCDKYKTHGFEEKNLDSNNK